MNWLKEKIGIPWLILITLGSAAFSITLAYEGTWWMILLFPVFLLVGVISILFIEWIKPDAIMTDGGFFGLLGAKLFWNFGAQVGTMFILGAIALAVVLGPILSDSIDYAKSEVNKYCAQEQIAKTGTKKCENAKKALKTKLNKALKPIKESYRVSNSSIKKLEKDKELKCSEKGLKDFGSQGCENVKQSLEAEKTKANDLDKRIKELEKELSDITKK